MRVPHRLVRLTALCFALLVPPFLFAQEGRIPAYVGSETCADCHSEAYDAWKTSHHGEAWRRPDETVLQGAFEGEIFEHKGMRATFDTIEGTRRISVVEEDGSEAVYDLHSVGGTYPLQHLILETEEGRLQSFDVVWDVDAQRWYHLYPEQDLPPQDAFHWSGAYKNWNARCAECHATGFEKNYDFRNKSYRSTQVEIGVGCEACHGPGEAHLTLQNGGTIDWAISVDDYGFTAQMADPKSAMEQCAGCHSRREAFGNGNPLPGTRFADAYNLAMLRPGLYHPDGQILDEVYVYGSFLQSKMHQKGVTCANCHTPHSAETLADDNALCTQCHSPAGNPEFPTLPLATYDSPDHTHHEEGTSGAQCVNCHMTDRVYMGTDPRRDHSFRVPRPDLTGKIGTPNACTACHDDKPARWAADQITQWFPQGQWTQKHYGEILEAGRLNPVAASTDLFTLAQNEATPGLIRATALWLLGPGAASLEIDALGAFLDNPDPQIRVGALDALKQRSPLVTTPYLLRGLNDETRAVRIAAARAILSQPPNRITDELRAATRQAYSELGGMIRNQLDFAEAHLQLGGYAMVAGDIRSAVVALTEAVRINPQTPQAWESLIRMTAQIEGRDRAREMAETALKLNPGTVSLIELVDQLN
ncbi:cytochrome c554/c'-like protein [Shimia isoporae]|uniref:Cytochrome c554/c'-like protein n=1 Tax=Shimia isoporae TaxID=647720 RepID=A0A4R1N4V8_9RHOB|nr:multiheme c-type cytochrome [Shimia isoporae]TCL00755.1 cytochrome c554/c'-like protein [Shimia isoporae]